MNSGSKTMANGHERNRDRLVKHSDLPSLSAEEQCVRHRLRLEIMFGSKCTEYLDAGPVSPVVQIMGLELLQCAADRAAAEEEDTNADYSYDSYANDSFQLAVQQKNPTGPMSGNALLAQPTNTVASNVTTTAKKQSVPLGAPPGRSMQRRMSSCSSIGEDSVVSEDTVGFGRDPMEVYGYERPMSPTKRRPSVGGGSSHASSVDYSKYKSTRRGSLESYAGDSVDYERSKVKGAGNKPPSMAPPAGDSVDYGRYKSTARRSSMDSYAGDSVEYGRFKTTLRRSSMGSCAGDSMDFGRNKSTSRASVGSNAGDSVDYGRYKSTRRASVGSYAGDSVDYGRYKSTRRASGGSNAEDSVDYGRYKSTARRSSMDSYAGDSVEYGRYKSTRRASVGSYAGDSVEYGRYKSSTRRSSLGSYAADSVDSNHGRQKQPQQQQSFMRQSSMESYAANSIDCNIPLPSKPVQAAAPKLLTPDRPSRRSSTGGAGFCLMPPSRPKPVEQFAGVPFATLPARRGSVGVPTAVSTTEPAGFCAMPRRASAGMAPVSTPAPAVEPISEYSRHRSSTRRRSVGSYAGDSVDYNRYMSTRRGSLDSFAGDSVDYGRYKSTRRGSLDSYAGDSVDHGRYKSTRRGSLDSYAGDSVDYGRYKSTRRGSLDSYAGDSVDLKVGSCSQGQERRFSNLSEYATDSVGMVKNSKNTNTNMTGSKRRMSLQSYSSHSCLSAADRSVDSARAA